MEGNGLCTVGQTVRTATHCNLAILIQKLRDYGDVASCKHLHLLYTATVLQLFNSLKKREKGQHFLLAICPGDCRLKRRIKLVRARDEFKFSGLSAILKAERKCS